MFTENQWYSKSTSAIAGRYSIESEEKQMELTLIEDDVVTSSLKSMLEWREKRFKELKLLLSSLTSKTSDINTYLVSDKDRLYLMDEDYILKKLDQECWTKIINASGIKGLMTTVQSKKMEAELELKPQLFSLENGQKQFSYYLENANKLFAERVEGVFRYLSKEHITNAPGRFSEKLIFSGIPSHYYFYESPTVAAIHDLRCCIGILMKNTDSICEYETHSILTRAQENCGEFIYIDGNSIAVKLHKKGTGHIHVEPNIADKLNDVLTYLYPVALSDGNRKPKLSTVSKGLSKSFVCHEALIPKDLREIIRNAKVEKDYELVKSNNIGREYERVYNGLTSVTVKKTDKPLVDTLYGELCSSVKPQFLEEISYIFDMSVEDVQSFNREVICNGIAPLDKVESQFYQTTEKLKGMVRDRLIGMDLSDKNCLEPNVGFGVLADLLPKTATVIDISEFNINYMKSRGYVNTVKGCFLKWCELGTKLYDLVLMNPPFSQNRWRYHIEAALSVLDEDGVCVAILPSTVKSKLEELSNTHSMTHEIVWEGTEEFEGTGKIGICVIEFVKDSSGKDVPVSSGLNSLLGLF